MTQPVFELENIHKRFGAVEALRGARLRVCPGEIHGLVGENGAGKSTLIRIASGVFPPDKGVLRIEGAPTVLAGPVHAAACGIAVVHQEADLFPQLSVAENMLLRRGLIRNRHRLIDWKSTYAEAEREIGTFGESFDVRAPAAGLSVARRMMAEIAAAVAQRTKVLFLDEPTSALTYHEIESLFAHIRRLREEGTAIVYVSHRLEEVLGLCDRITVMRDGETVSEDTAAAFTMDSLVAAMIGRDSARLFEKPTLAKGAVRLQVKHLGDAAGAFRDVTFDVHAGEIFGIYGFVGAGRSELAQTLFGLRRIAQGEVRVDGATVRIRSPQDAVAAGMAYLPEDRLVQGIFPTHPLRSNATVSVLKRLCTATWIRHAREAELASRIIADTGVKADSMEQPMTTLSGGNQQKVVFGRWQAVDPKVLILDEPTRGVDVSAKVELHRLITESAARGVAVVLISSELPEVSALSDRILVMAEGKPAGIFKPDEHTEHDMAQAAVPRSPVSAIEQEKEKRQRDRKRSRAAVLMRARESGLLGFTLLLAIGMAFLKPAEFANTRNLLDVLANAALPAIMAQGAMLVICAGGIDISVGSMMGLVGAVAALAAKAGVPPLVCLCLAIGTGIVFSLANAGTALLARIHPIIVTLAGISIYRGVMRIVTAGREVLQLPEAYRALGLGNFLGIPKICWYAACVTFAIHIFMRYTLSGRRVLALGNSARAAWLIGLSKTRLTLLTFGISGALVGLTAVLHAGFYGNVQANTGEGWELRAIAAAVIGGTNILGGRGSAVGALLGACLTALLYNALILMRISSYWQNFFIGGLILLAVIADKLLHENLTEKSS